MLIECSISTKEHSEKIIHEDCNFRSSVAEFLLEGGQMGSWLVGNKIVKITTSGGGKVGRSGLCDKCLAFAQRASGKVINPVTPSETPGRKRHRSAAVRSR